MQLWKIAVLAAGGLVCACGGGGAEVQVEPSAPAGVPAEAVPAITPATAADRASIMASVRLFDSLNALPRLLAVVPGGFEAYLRPPGSAVTQACAGGGTIMVQKVTPARATVVASNCRPYADSNVVYDGAWALGLTSNTYEADGSCVAPRCQAIANVDATSARYGYGSATTRPSGSFFFVQGVSGQRTSFINLVLYTIQVSPTFQPTVSGTDIGFSGEEKGIRVLDVQAVGPRTLQLTQPFRATVTLGSSVVAAIDKDGDGAAETTTTIPWAEFVD